MLYVWRILLCCILSVWALLSLHEACQHVSHSGMCQPQRNVSATAAAVSKPQATAVQCVPFASIASLHHLPVMLTACLLHLDNF